MSRSANNVLVRKPTPFSTRFVKAVKARNFKALATLANDILKDRFAPYVALDYNGTYQLCWTMNDAREWFPYLGNEAMICETYDYTILEARIQMKGN